MGKRIKELIIQNETSATSIADQMYVNRSTVSKWTSGTHKPKSDKLKQLAKCLGCTPEYILNGITDTDADTDYIIQTISELPSDLKISIKILLQHLKSKLEIKKK